MPDTQYKQYVIEFKLYDGTTRHIPIEIPMGEDGGFYTPATRKISDTEIEISFTPSKEGMPVVEPVTVSAGNVVDLTGYATEQWVREEYQPKGNYLTEHQDISGKLDADKLPDAINEALAQAKESGAFDGKPGYTPQKNVDYYTEADKKEMVNLVIAALPVYNGEVEIG